jgi:hypothetical protein
MKETTTALSPGFETKCEPICVVSTKANAWWQEVFNGANNSEWWRDNLRMSQVTFEFICNDIRPYIESQVTRFRDPISVEVRVAITIWRLATNIEYRTLGGLFGLGRSTVGEIVLDTCDAIPKFLLPKYACVPQSGGLQEIIDGFDRCWGFHKQLGQLMALKFLSLSLERVVLTILTARDTIR